MKFQSICRSPVFAMTVFSLLSVFSNFAQADELKIFAYRSPGINWRSPRLMVKSVLRNSIEMLPHSIGHVSVELKCDATTSHDAIHEFGGMTNLHDSEANKYLLFQGGGLGMLFHSLVGTLDGQAEIEKDNLKSARQHRINYMAYDISPSTCERLATYIQEYRETKQYLHYGLPNRPRYGEGAGCSAFGMSFLELAGLLTPELKDSWSRLIYVPKRLVGGELTGRRVSILRLLLRDRFTSRWATPDEPNFSVFFYDPDKIYSWIKMQIANESQNPSGQYQVEHEGGMPGVRIDVRSVPTPIDPIWIKNI